MVLRYRSCRDGYSSWSTEPFALPAASSTPVLSSTRVSGVVSKSLDVSEVTVEVESSIDMYRKDKDEYPRVKQFILAVTTIFDC